MNPQLVPHPIKRKKRFLDEVDGSPSLARKHLEQQAMKDMYPMHPGRKPLKKMPRRDD